MHVYIIMLIVSIIFAYAAEKSNKKNNKIVFEICSMLPFIIVSAIRFDVGTDYMSRYAPNFETIRLGGSVKNLEVGFKIIIHICIFLFNNYESLFVMTTLIIIPIIMHQIFKYSKKPTLSIFIFFAGCYFFHSLNILRQYIAIALILLAYRYLLENSYKKFYIYIILAFFIHYTSIVCVLAIFMRKKIIFIPPVLLFLITIILVFSTQLNGVLNSIIENTYYNVYVNSRYNIGTLNNSALILNVFVYLFMYYLGKKGDFENDNKISFFINIQSITVIFIAMAGIFSLFYRISFYFSIVQIISIPYILYSDKIIKKSGFIKKCLIIFIIVFLINITYNNVLNNVDEVLPYKTIFNKVW